ncbi:hypothetical protein ACFL4P_02610 [Gemmatimonadota bacterium]
MSKYAQYSFLLLLLGVGAFFYYENRVTTADKEPVSQKEPCTSHCQLLRAGEIEVIVGDGSRARHHPGIWMMTNIHRPFNIFHNRSAAMLGGGLRGRSPVLEKIDENSCALVKPATRDDPSEIRAVFRVSPPYYLDYEHTIRDTENRIPKDMNYRSVAWCNYTNSPEDQRIHFLSNGEWLRHTPEFHGGPGSTIAPSYVADSLLEVWPETDDPGFWWYKRLDRRFDEPFYYGRFGESVVIWVYDTPRRLRFHLSPEGGGRSLIPGKTSTAWDFEYIIPEKEYQVGREYTFRVRMIYKKYVDDEDVLREVRKAQEELGFEKVQKK